MKQHAELGVMERNVAEDFGGEGECDQGIEQSRRVTNERNAQPDQSHHSLFFSSRCSAGGGHSPPHLGDYSVPGEGGMAKQAPSQVNVTEVTGARTTCIRVCLHAYRKCRVMKRLLGPG